MTDDRAELLRLIMGRTATAAVEAVLAAGYRKDRRYKLEEWESCPKGPHSQAAHLLDCDQAEPDSKTMAEVLAEHQVSKGNRGMTKRCTCGWWGQPLGNNFEQDMLNHQADALAVAGFGQGTRVTITPCDPEAYARGHNDGYEAAIAQGLADDPTLADDWLQAKLRAARVDALEESARDLDRRIAELKGDS